jgi:TonB family protein
MTPGVLRRRFSLAIALLVHAIIIVLVIGFTMIPRSPAGSGGDGVGLEFAAGDGDVNSEPAQTLPLPPTEVTADAGPIPPLPAPAVIKRMEIKPGGRPGGDLFFAKVRAHLAQFRRELPAGAQHQGVVELRFKLSTAGAVTDARIAKSSGDAVLDNEALSLLARAAPLPSRGWDTELIVPIEFETSQGQPQ